MAGELQETTRLFARNIAAIERAGCELAAHLVETQLLEPHWDKKAARWSRSSA